MVKRGSSSRATCTTSCISSKGQGNGSPPPETRAFATDKSWRCTETSSPQLTTSLTKPLFSCRSPAPKATIRWHTFHTLSRGQSDERSGSSFHLLLLMRLFGLVAFTAAVAYAIAITPVLKWAFVLIALLPVAIYNRSVLSADGSALCSALVITALCLSAVYKSVAAPVWQRSLWMTLCALSKQPQIVFVLLELMVYPLKELRRRWSRVAIVVLPSLILSPMWVVAVSAEIAAWRLQLEESHPPEHFDPIWKLHYMWEHPGHFPMAVWRALSDWGDQLWRELIGILGWQDIVLPTWTYLVLTILLMLVPLQKLQLDGATRARVMVITGLTVLGYFAVVYLIFFLTYTPLDIDHVRGVQGRYFVIALPVAAIFVAAIINLELPNGMSAAIATAGAMSSGIATVEALYRAHW